MNALNLPLRGVLASRRASALSSRSPTPCSIRPKSRHGQVILEAKLLQDQAQKLQEKQQLLDEVQRLKVHLVSMGPAGLGRVRGCAESGAGCEAANAAAGGLNGDMFKGLSFIEGGYIFQVFFFFFLLVYCLASLAFWCGFCGSLAFGFGGPLASPHPANG